jgi:hypothetical protein
MRPRCHLPECLPDDVHKDGVVWRSLEEVRDDIAKRRRPLHPEVVKKLFDRWRAVKDQLDREWMAEQSARVAEIALEINRDRQRQWIDDEEQKRRDYLAADAAENLKWAALVTEAQHRANKKEARKLRKGIVRDHQIIKEAIRRKFGRPDPYQFPGAM